MKWPDPLGKMGRMRELEIDIVFLRWIPCQYIQCCKNILEAIPERLDVSFNANDKKTRMRYPLATSRTLSNRPPRTSTAFSEYLYENFLRIVCA